MNCILLYAIIFLMVDEDFNVECGVEPNHFQVPRCPDTCRSQNNAELQILAVAPVHPRDNTGIL